LEALAEPVFEQLERDGVADEDEVPAELGLDRRRHLVERERGGGLLERRVELLPVDAAELAPVARRSRVGRLLAGDLLEAPARRSAVVTLMLRRCTSRSTTSCVTTCVSQMLLPPDLMVPSVAAISFLRLGLSAIADSWRSTESRERSFPFTVSADGRTALQLAATAPIAAIATSATGTRT